MYFWQLLEADIQTHEVHEGNSNDTSQTQPKEANFSLLALRQTYIVKRYMKRTAKTVPLAVAEASFAGGTG